MTKIVLVGLKSTPYITTLNLEFLTHPIKENTHPEYKNIEKNNTKYECK